jgi:hypothetical protein
MQSLADNPAGSGGVYNSQKPPDQGNELAIVNQLKDRELRDFKDKAGFMADLSLKQERLRNMYDPTALHQPGEQQQGSMQPQVSQIKDPNAMSGYEKGELGVKQQGMNLEQQKLDQNKQLGQEAADTKSAQEKLNQQKSDQIHAQKIAELQQKTDQATAKMKEEHDKLVANTADHTQHIEFIKAKAAADAAIAEQKHHEVDAKQAEEKRKNDATIAGLQERLRQSGSKSTTTTLSDDGKSKNVTTTTGSSSGKTVQVKGPRTKDNPTGKYEIPGDKVDDWNANHANQPDQIGQPVALAGPQAGQDDEENDSSENGR